MMRLFSLVVVAVCLAGCSGTYEGRQTNCWSAGGNGGSAQSLCDFEPINNPNISQAGN